MSKRQSRTMRMYRAVNCNPVKRNGGSRKKSAAKTQKPVQTNSKLLKAYFSEINIEIKEEIERRIQYRIEFLKKRSHLFAA